jgi:hypothetical protein
MLNIIFLFPVNFLGFYITSRSTRPSPGIFTYPFHNIAVAKKSRDMQIEKLSLLF